MLGSAGAASPLTYRQQDNGAEEAVSFAARPLVAPASVAAKGETGRSGDAGQRLAKSDDIAPVADDGAAAEASRVRRGVLQPETPGQRPAVTGAGAGERLAAYRTAGATDPGVTPLPAAPQAHRRALGDGIMAGAPVGPSKQSGMTRGAVPTTFDLGDGVKIHLAADAASLRVLVRGARLDAQERGEVTTRIIRLLRGHGVAISKRSIEFDGGTNG
ncbi:hypothetical protein FHR22_001644 [Sphingopyxis panaciterrae]|uniref:hypothetical protein n=1 Tax=Sphingopyxis panaciterrae TaxID=363841 RepID=UPI001424600A|nr:hypothetical protein [Sphingopyxis panaciterrae]NIJ36960.1 hypothetical protein [Sphingopyxis panaciterrae]